MAKKQTKRTRRRRAARAPAPQTDRGLISATQQLCSYTNPFCDVAKGAKWPDGAAIKSVTMDGIGGQTFATDANGNLSVVCISTEKMVYSVGTVTSNGYTSAFTDIWEFPGNSWAEASRYRITSVGFKISCLSTRMNTQGMLRLRLFSPQSAASLSSVDIATPYADQVLDVPLSRLIEKDIYVTVAAVGINARIFKDTGNTFPTDIAGLVAAGEQLEWQTLVASVVGGQVSTNCLEIVCYQHYERIYPDGHVNSRFATPAKRANQSYIDAAINTTRSIGGFIEGAAKTVDNIYHSRAAQILLNYFPATRGANRAITAARNSLALTVD